MSKRAGRWLLAFGIVLAVVAAFVWHHQGSARGPLYGTTTVRGLFSGTDHPPNHLSAIILYVIAAATSFGGVVLMLRGRTDPLA